MAIRAGVAERGRRMDRVGIIIIGLMTAIAIRRRAAVHAIRMTGCTGSGDVSAGQRIVGLCVMIEARRRPGGRAVAIRAGVAEGRRGVNRIGVVIIALMTAIAICRRAAVHTIRMAGCAGGGDVSAGQRVAGLSVVIKARWRPGSGVVANSAGETERGRGMNGIYCAGEIVVVAGVAFGRRAAVPLAVASYAIQADVGTRQGEGSQIVIKADFVPTARDMTHFATGWIAIGDMIGIGGSFKFLLVAGVTESRRPGVYSVGVAFGTIS